MRDTLNRLLLKQQTARETVKRERAALKQAKHDIETVTQAQSIVQHVAEAVQMQAHKQIASVVTRCLEAVFGEDAYEFAIVFSRKRGRTEAALVFRRDGLEISPLEAAGGGAVDVAAFALRLACLVLRQPKLRRLLVLDEPWKHLSAEYRPHVRTLLETLAKEMDIQFVIVTHSEEFACGKVYEL